MNFNFNATQFSNALKLGAQPKAQANQFGSTSLEQSLKADMFQKQDAQRKTCW